MTDPSVQRSFSEAKHRSGMWRTHDAAVSNRLIRALWCYLSLKRQGIERLARSCRPQNLVVDCGSGSGAYSRWFLASCPCTVIAVDWSLDALRAIRPSQRGRIARVCADASMLPFRAAIADALFTIDTLGHVADQERALDEMLRVSKPGSRLFVHSECGDHRARWPDRMLIKRLGRDCLADLDGHVSIRSSDEIRGMLTRRFRVHAFYSPAGLAGWLLGYPEKYRIAFKLARRNRLAMVVAVFAFVKRMPVAGAILRFVNATTNRLELFLGMSGGGSCFAEVVNPGANNDNGDLT